MGRKTVLQPYRIADVSLAASANSVATSCINEDSIGYQCYWHDNDCVGTVVPQGLILASAQNPSSVERWVTIPCEPIALTGSSDVQGFDLDVRMFQKVRLSYTKSSGTAGTLEITVIGKVVGA